MEVSQDICNKEIKPYINCIKKKVTNKPELRDMKKKECAACFYDFINCIKIHINEN